MSASTPRRKRPGFTFVELLVVVGIIVMLLGLVAVAVGRVRTAASRLNDL